MKCGSPLIWRIEKSKIREVHQEIVALEHCIAAESPALYPI